MGERYLISGVQLGLLQSMIVEKEREGLVSEIIDKQFVGNSSKQLLDDVEKVDKVGLR